MLDAFTAATRFGLGARPGELAASAHAPGAQLRDQLGTPSLLAGPAGADLLAEVRSLRDDPPRSRDRAREILIGEAGRRTLHMVRSSTPFFERWMAFWSNHFTVSVQRREVLALAGAFEREAIRPHVLGRFEDLLVASIQHPAMLVYLDNVRSIGPSSLAGRRSQRGLNENLAREVLELHTLGVDSGYEQADVEALARLLTGWSVDPESGGYRFDARRHEPGSTVLLGLEYPGLDEIDGLAALTDLARHPATARHLAGKIARHFIADDPPPKAVAHLEAAWLASRGDLRAVGLSLLDCPGADAPPTKLKTPQDLVVSVGRAIDFRGEAERLVASLRLLGQLPWSASSPQGWPDTQDDWLAPEALLTRLEWLEKVSERASSRVDPMKLGPEILGSRFTPALRRALEAASAPTQRLALLFASPAFQRR